MGVGEYAEKNKFVFLLMALVLFLLLLAHHASNFTDPGHVKVMDFCLTKAGEVIAAFLTIVVAGKAAAEPVKHDTETKVTTVVATDAKK